MKRTLVTLMLAGALALSACTPRATVVPVPTPAPATPRVEMVTPTATVPPPRSLTICLAQEPQTLYLYGGSSLAMSSVLQAIYDGPVDYYSYAYHPVILQKLPSLADGDAVIQAVAVQPAETVVDDNGNLATLVKGVKVRPSGCNSSGCAVEYDGKSPLQMDQMTATFKLLPNLTWSDGAPLTADDSVYSYGLAADPATQTSKFTTDRTTSYKAVDAQTAQWIGRPGYLDNRYFTNFWQPLPKHAWSKYSAADLPQVDAAARKPIGWGPYVIDEWAAGDHIRLHKNPAYFRASEGLPKFDNLVFRFIGANGDAAVNILANGECDLVDQTSLADEALNKLLELKDNPKVKAVFSQGPNWEHLDFGIKPSAYDDGYNAAQGDRPDFFGDVRTRQAVAYCIDRKAILNQLLGGKSSIPNTYVPTNHPLYDPGAVAYDYNPAKGEELLEQVGWKKAGSDPQAPRQALGIPNVPDGTQFIVTYLTTKAPLREQVSQKVVESLSKCGIQVNVVEQSPGDLFGEGPNGVVFGRKFDLVEFSWETNLDPLCFLYMSSTIPSAANHWNGVNVTGYTNPAFDQACQAAREALPGAVGFNESQVKPQEIFSQDLPVLPLYLQIKAALTRPDFCGFAYEPTNRSELWNLEKFDYGKGCNP